ncbi:lantibiotic modifying enzyme [Streptomyces sp. WAC05292]|uniref:lanthionine synthetase C family protein n=1 Tax=Streptomyces sp. WAC05292 TaxID=2487418 RepID=UPI000F7457D7|nr:lanthionine synthetase C family protein [Streptomyces sp. WAC05292]RSS94237.1 lantibiotic modifying enzyme [Streptomyces sp. WAC05292]
MTVTTTAPNVLTAADALARSLSDPASVWPGGRPDGWRAWPQSLAGGAAGIALLHIERARSGHGDWDTAHLWLTESVRGEISGAFNANLYFGTPALAFLVHRAHSATGRYERTLQRLDAATEALTRTRLAVAHERLRTGVRPPMEEFDLIRGLAGLGAHHLSRYGAAETTAAVLTYLVRLTEPLPAPAGLPPWWMDVGTTGELHPDYPGGHGNFGLAHGIGAALAVMAQALLRGLDVPGLTGAVERVCAWMDQWRQGDESCPWWPGLIVPEQVADGTVEPDLRPRASWCYGISGTARAQQLAGLALRDATRVRTAENAIVATLSDPAQLDRLPEIGLCHGMAGLLQASWRVATETGNTAITEQLPHLAGRLIAAVNQPGHEPELLDGAAGAALALHTLGTNHAPAPHWDTFLALA